MTLSVFDELWEIHREGSRRIKENEDEIYILEDRLVTLRAVNECRKAKLKDIDAIFVFLDAKGTEQ